MPSSSRGRNAIRKAVGRALVLLTGEPTAQAAIENLRAKATAVESAPVSHAVPRPVPRSQRPSAKGWGDSTSQDADANWPTVPVWVWFQQNDTGSLEAHADVSPKLDLEPVLTVLPASREGLLRLWGPVQSALKKRQSGAEVRSTVPIWIWTDDESRRSAPLISFERLDGVKANQVSVPTDLPSLEVMNSALGTAMVRLTGASTPSDAAELLRRQVPMGMDAGWPNGPNRRVKPTATAGRPARKPAKEPAGKVAKKPAPRARKRGVPRIRIVSGGLPGLGKRR
jgi:hypothetical protein